jgi:hypothetical protein
MAKGELTTTSIRINGLRNKIIEGEIKIPPFQRNFVWKQEQIIELLDSIVNDFPIGGLLLWETIEKLPSNRNIGGFKLPDSKAEYPISYVLDGQQRITSIFGVFSFELEYKADEGTSNVFEVYYDLTKSKFVGKKDLEPANKFLPLKLLFDNFNFNTYLHESQFTTDESKEAVRIQGLFQDYDIPIVIIKKRSKGEVGVIFERINNTGKPLSTLDLMIAWTWKEDFHLKEKFDEIYESLDNKNFGNTKDKILLQCLSAIIKSTTRTVEILSLDPNVVRSKMELLKGSVEHAIDYISTQFNANSEDFLPKAQQLVGLAYLFSKKHSLSSLQTKFVQNWFWRTSFSDRYSSSTDSKMDEDIQFMDELLKDNFSAIDRYVSDVNANMLRRQPFSKSNSYVRAILLLLSKANPLNLTNGQLVDTGSALSNYNKKEYHHIFPNAYLKRLGRKTHEINSICNFCFLPANSNKIISNREPSEYFFDAIPFDMLDTILDSNLIPLRKSLYEKNNYDDFLDERAALLVDRIKIATNE